MAVDLLHHLLLLLLLTIVIAASTVQFDISQNPAVRDTQLRRRSEYKSPSKRAGTVTTLLGNSLSQGLYFANVSIGTPAQTVALQIDTGSSDVWIPSSTAALCGNTRAGGCPDGSFTASQSSSFFVVGQNEFNISYVDGSGSSGDYFQDTFEIGGSKLSNFQMGLARTTTIGNGIMGIGYNTSEANLDKNRGGNGTIYQNLPLALVSQGKINSVAYSLWLNDLQSSSGSILFGGIDTAKYKGDLISVDVYPTSHRLGVTSFTVAFTSLSATSSSGTDQLTPPGYAMPAILDSGTTITFLPNDVAALVFQELGAMPEAQIGAVVVPCALAQNNGTLNYGFGGASGPIIKVAVSDLVLPLIDSRGRPAKYDNGEAACQLGIQPAGDMPVLFGDTFLRSAYAVYDLSNNRIALAQTDFNATASNIVPFANLGAAIPSARVADRIAQVTQTASGIPKVGATVTPSGTGALNFDPTATGLSASSGFTTVNTPSSKKNVAGARPKPFEWSILVVAVISISFVGLGGCLLHD